MSLTCNVQRCFYPCEKVGLNSPSRDSQDDLSGNHSMGSISSRRCSVNSAVARNGPVSCCNILTLFNAFEQSLDVKIECSASGDGRQLVVTQAHLGDDERPWDRRDLSSSVQKAQKSVARSRMDNAFTDKMDRLGSGRSIGSPMFDSRNDTLRSVRVPGNSAVHLAVSLTNALGASSSDNQAVPPSVVFRTNLTDPLTVSAVFDFPDPRDAYCFELDSKRFVSATYEYRSLSCMPKGDDNRGSSAQTTSLVEALAQEDQTRQEYVARLQGTGTQRDRRQSYQPVGLLPSSPRSQRRLRTTRVTHNDIRRLRTKTRAIEERGREDRFCSCVIS